MKVFAIASGNAEKAQKAFTATTSKSYGYTESALLTAKNPRIIYTYQIDKLDNNIIVCTIRHKELEALEAVVVLEDYTPDSITVSRAELYRNCSNYPYRRETSERYLGKYDQIACIVHGAITTGLLLPTREPTHEPQETTTSPETDGDRETTTNSTREPQEATQAATATTNGATTGAAPTHTTGTEKATRTDASTAPDEIPTDNTRRAERPTENRLTPPRPGPLDVKARRKKYLVKMFKDLAKKRRKARKEATKRTESGQGIQDTTHARGKPYRVTESTHGRPHTTTARREHGRPNARLKIASAFYGSAIKVGAG